MAAKTTGRPAKYLTNSERIIAKREQMSKINKSRVNIKSVLPAWISLKNEIQAKDDEELAFFLIEQYGRGHVRGPPSSCVSSKLESPLEAAPSVPGANQCDTSVTGLCQNMPDIVQLHLYIKPLGNPVVLRSEGAAIMYGDVVETNYYELNFLNPHMLQLDKPTKYEATTTIKQEFPGCEDISDTDMCRCDDVGGTDISGQTESSVLPSVTSKLDSSDIPFQNQTHAKISKDSMFAEPDIKPSEIGCDPNNEQNDVENDTRKEIHLITQDLSPADIKMLHPEICSDGDIGKTSGEEQLIMRESIENFLECDVETYHHCQHCEFTSPQWDLLQIHIDTTHQLDQFQDDFTDTSPERPTSVNEQKPVDFLEMLTQGNNIRYCCRMCICTFKRKSAAENHVRLHHMNEDMRQYQISCALDHSNDESFLISDSSKNDEDFHLPKSSMTSHKKLPRSKNSTEEYPVQLLQGVSGRGSNDEVHLSNGSVKSPTKLIQNKKSMEKNPSELLDCPVCGSQFGTERSLRGHLGRAHKNNQQRTPLDHVICHLCGEVYDKISDLSKHVRSKHQSAQTKTIKYHQKLERMRQSGPVQCSRNGCDKILSNKLDLRKHINKVHRTKTFPCDVCEKQFRNNSRLRHHKEVVHLRIRNISCSWPDCDKTFGTNWSMKVHMRIHTGEKPLQCELCGFTARQGNSLRYHVSVHHKKDAPDIGNKSSKDSNQGVI